jgi:hypothetical protein
MSNFSFQINQYQTQILVLIPFNDSFSKSNSVKTKKAALLSCLSKYTFRFTHKTIKVCLPQRSINQSQLEYLACLTTYLIFYNGALTLSLVNLKHICSFGYTANYLRWYNRTILVEFYCQQEADLGVVYFLHKKLKEQTYSFSLRIDLSLFPTKKSLT